MTSPGGASRYYEVNYVLIPCLLIQTGLSRGIWSMPKSYISISAAYDGIDGNESKTAFLDT